MRKLLLLPLILIVVTAPIGATILGCVALSQIRRSGGKLYGLGLALFDALVFPLLVLDAGISLVWYVFARGFQHWTESVYPARITLLTILTSLVVDALLVRAAWRAAKKPLPQVSP